ncbi:MAG TPA: YlxR family protein [Nocardioidaceae bacterium]|nr:YlxR family protein [Nocardioidaceae bacterium]
MARRTTPDACANAPVRTCVGCRQRAAKQELLRVVASDQGSGPAVVPDPGRRAPGRGAHLHPTPECLELALRRRAFSRALRVGNGLSGDAVRDYVQQLAQQGNRP